MSSDQKRSDEVWSRRRQNHESSKDDGDGMKNPPCPTSSSSSLRCPRCESPDTKFCYYNNYSTTQPRHFCKNCKRYWTAGGSLRNVPVGGGLRKNKSKSSARHGHGHGNGGSSNSSSSSSTDDHLLLRSLTTTNRACNPNFDGGSFPTYDESSSPSPNPNPNPNPNPVPELRYMDSTTAESYYVPANPNFIISRGLPPPPHSAIRSRADSYLNQAHEQEQSSDGSVKRHRAMPNPAALFSSQTQPRDFHDNQGGSIAGMSGAQDELLLLKNGICGAGINQSFGSSHHTQYHHHHHHHHHHHQSNAAELLDQPLMSYFSVPSIEGGNAKNQGVTEDEGSRGIIGSVEEDEEEGLGNVVNVRYPYDWEQVSQVLFGGTPDFFQMPGF